VDWLSARSGKLYRLPSEAEWEYAARAGSNAIAPATGPNLCHALNGGDADYHRQFALDPMYYGACHDGYAYTAPVGSFPPNAFGLFDMTGNVFQWTEDCYNETYDGAPTDGSAWMRGECSMRVVRGGAWMYSLPGLRFARRGKGSLVGRFNANGFRVARNL